MLQVHASPLQDCLHVLPPRFNAHFHKLVLHDKVVFYVFWPPHTTYLVHSWYFTILRSTHFVLRPFLVVSCPIYRHSLRFPCIHGPMRVTHIILEWIRTETQYYRLWHIFRDTLAYCHNCSNTYSRSPLAHAYSSLNKQHPMQSTDLWYIVFFLCPHCIFIQSWLFRTFRFWTSHVCSIYPL